MRECWINVYKWYNCYNNKYAILTGTYHFESKERAIAYITSWGLSVAYRIHVRMK